MSNCPEGYYRRSGYTRKFTSNVLNSGFTVRRKGKLITVKPDAAEVEVASFCAKKPVRRSLTARIGPLRKGDLIKYGYQFRLSDKLRHKALEKAIKVYTALGVYHKLDAVAKLAVTSAPDASAIFKKDREWVHRKFM